MFSYFLHYKAYIFVHCLATFLNTLLFLSANPEFVLSKRGVRLINMNGYMFSKHISRTIAEGVCKIRWYCQTHHSAGCKAVIFTIDDNFNSFLRDPKNLYFIWCLFIIFTVNYVISRRGRRLLQLNGYTYSFTPSKRGKTRWRCSTHNHHGCRAVVHTCDERLVYTYEVHNH
ncbi:hypothetical protein ABMA27_001359 [Loxostege sticticalis]|uniref:FLYWCH-type domain-containing protein n=1 Tax=Loxostege sticticalis TaxID=481309 RepID=A0ABR3HYG5_LOXSC